MISPSLRNQVFSVQDLDWSSLKYRDLDGRDNLDELHFSIVDEIPVIGEPMPDGVSVKYDRITDWMWLWYYHHEYGIGPQPPGTSFRMRNTTVTVRGPEAE